ncbi:AAA family ATPase [Desulfovibrio desulfuricans]|uniref:AAA family ATPase n=1 Tax=Desulfovibrio desulfuricans TaxID=876 RepID=UPI0035B115E7
MITPAPENPTSNNLQNALAFHEWHPQARLFPCSRYEGGQHKALVRWSQASSCERAQIEAWWQKYPGSYFCLDAVRSPFVILDPDDKAGRDGNATLAELEKQYGSLPPTLGSKTPSGRGRHLLFKCGEKLKTGADRLGIGLDVPVMVPLPGQFVPGKGQYTQTGGPECADLPVWVVQMAGRASEKKGDGNLNVPAQGVTLDLDAHVLEAVIYALKEAPGASEGNRDRMAFGVASRLRGFGLTPMLALKIMIDFWAERPDVEIISEANLHQKVRSAYENARDRIGENLPEAVFDKVEMPQREFFEDTEELPSSGPRWAVEDYIPLHGVTLLFGESNVYKSFLGFDWAYCVASGRSWCGQEVVQGPVLYLAGEGASGLRARGMAWKKHNSINTKLPIFFRTIPAAFCQQESVATIKRLVAQIEALRGPLALLVVDTLATNFGAGDESSNRDMSQFIAGVNEAMGHRGARVIIHHSGQRERDRERGAYALRAGLDAIFQLKRVDTGKAPGCFLQCSKMRDAEYPSPRAFTALGVQLGFDAGGKSLSSVVLQEIPAASVAVVPAKHLTEKQAAILDTVRALSVPGYGAAVEKVVKVAISKGVYDRTDKVHSAISSLEKQRQVFIREGVIQCAGF